MSLVVVTVNTAVRGYPELLFSVFVDVSDTVVGQRMVLISHSVPDSVVLVTGGVGKTDDSVSSSEPVEPFGIPLDGDGNLLAGTDNGLYVYQNDNGTLQHIVHDSRNIQSLTNNIIWNIFADQEQNIWLGTDYGISLGAYIYLIVRCADDRINSVMGKSVALTVE